MKTPSAVLLLLLSACASYSKERGHDEVARLVEERTGQKTHWESGGPEEQEISDHVSALLKEGLTRERAIAVALVNNRDLQATYEELGISQADMVQAGLLKNPSLGLHLGIPLTPSSFETEVSLVQDFLDLFVLPVRKGIAQDQFVADTLKVAHQALLVAAEVSKAFFAVQAGERLVGIRRQVQEGAAAVADLAQRQFDAGNIHELNLLTQQASAEQTRFELGQDELELIEAREKLNHLLGLFGDQTAWRLATSLQGPPAVEFGLEKLEATAVRRRLDIAAARKQVEILARAEELARTWRFFGRIDVGVVGHQDPDGPRLIGPSLTLDLPIFDQRQAVIARLGAQRRQGERRLAALSIEARSDVRATAARVSTARRAAERYQNVLLPMREKLVQQTQLHYNGMQIGLMQLLSARREQIEALRGLVIAQRDYWSAVADLERATGGTLVAGVKP